MQGSMPVQKIVRKPEYRAQNKINDWLRGKPDRDKSTRDESRSRAAWWSQVVKHVR